MTDKDFCNLYTEASAASDRELFVAEYATSIIFGDPQGLTDDDLLSNADLCGKTWDVAHMTIKDLCKMAGLSQVALSARFCVPYRTVQDWYSGRSGCPQYTKLAMAELLGIIRVPRQ